jgi:hypothetical protein
MVSFKYYLNMLNFILYIKNVNAIYNSVKNGNIPVFNWPL